MAVRVWYAKKTLPYLLHRYSRIGCQISHYTMWTNLSWDEWEELHDAITKANLPLLKVSSGLRNNKRGFYSLETIALIEAILQSPDGEQKNRFCERARAAIQKDRAGWNARHRDQKDAQVEMKDGTV